MNLAKTKIRSKTTLLMLLQCINPVSQKNIISKILKLNLLLEGTLDLYIMSENNFFRKVPGYQNLQDSFGKTMHFVYLLSQIPISNRFFLQGTKHAVK